MPQPLRGVFAARGGKKRAGRGSGDGFRAIRFVRAVAGRIHCRADYHSAIAGPQQPLVATVWGGLRFNTRSRIIDGYLFTSALERAHP